MPLQEDDLTTIWLAWKDRYTDRDDRMGILDEVVKGDFSVFDPDEEAIDNSSPNLIQVALEDTTEAASSLPTLRVTPHRTGPTAKRKATRMEKVGQGYLEFSQIDFLIPQTILDIAGFGFSPWVVWPDDTERMPVIEKRDPRECYPEPGFRPGHKVNRCLFSREVFFSQLPEEYQLILHDFLDQQDEVTIGNQNTRVHLVEYYAPDEIVIGALMEASVPGNDFSTSTYYPVILERLENPIGVCPVVLGSRFSLDGDFRGQFDQVVDVLKAHVRLMGLVLDYSDQAVYSDIWVKDLIGELSWGGGAYIELGPQGDIGRVPPAVSSLDVQRDLDRLVEGIHVGGRWPRSRPGEVDQSIASAKFIEAAAGMMNTTIKTYHQIVRRMLEQALRLCYITDKSFFPGEKTASGILRNQEFVEEYDASKDIELRNKIRVEYGLGFGRDPATTAVLNIQYGESGYISRETVQENIDGITDVARERARVDLQEFRGMALKKLLEGLEAGAIPASALVEIARAREQGDDLFEIFQKYVADPEEEQAPPGGMLGGAPPPEALLPGAEAGPGGAAPPAPPEAADLLARIGVPSGPPGPGGGPSGTLGAQVQG